MKYILIRLFFLVILLIPTVVSAHTELTSSSPAAHSVVTEEISDITLTFGGKIESLSMMHLIKDGQELEIENVQVKGNQLIGIVGSSLKSGAYTIKWNIAGEDGHPIEGEIPFTVQLSEDNNEEQTGAETIKEENTEEEQKEDTNKPVENKNLIKTIVPIVAILLLVVGLATLFKRKK